MARYTGSISLVDMSDITATPGVGQKVLCLSW